jgi:hypothetical protein
MDIALPCDAAIGVTKQHATEENKIAETDSFQLHLSMLPFLDPVHWVI